MAKFRSALQIAGALGHRTEEGIVLYNIGKIYHAQRWSDEALIYYAEALQIARALGERAREGAILGNIGLVYEAQRRYEAALDNFESALQIARALGNRTGEMVALTGIGKVYLAQGRYEAALGHFEQAIELTESIRATAGRDQERASYIDQYIALYNHTIALYCQQDRPEAAFFTGERSRARVFLDSLATRQVSFSRQTEAELYAREQAAYARRQALQVELARARTLDFTLTSYPE